MSEKIPAISGSELIELLVKDGWECVRNATHGASLKKYDTKTKRTKVVIIPTKPGSLPPTTLGRILSVKQSGIGRKGLLKLLEKFS